MYSQIPFSILKKNRYVAWTGNEKDEPIIKGLGLSDSNPLWIRKWCKKILVQLVEHPETRFQVIPTVEVFSDSGRNPEDVEKDIPAGTQNNASL